MNSRIVSSRFLVFFVMFMATVALLLITWRWSTGELQALAALLAGLMTMATISGARAVFEAEDEPVSFGAAFLAASLTTAEGMLRELGRIPATRSSVSRVDEITYEELLARDPQLALAKLRIDLELAMRRLAEQSSDGGQEAAPSATAIAKLLVSREILPQVLEPTIREVMRVCTRAIHGERVSEASSRQIIELGTRLLSILNGLKYSRPTAHGTSWPVQVSPEA